MSHRSNVSDSRSNAGTKKLSLSRETILNLSVRSAIRTGAVAPTQGAECASENCKSKDCTIPPKV